MPALDAGQLTKLRSSPQTSDWYCIPIVPTVVFAALINGTPAIGAVTIPYDTVTSGAFGNVKKGMTLLVGTSAGDDDVAIIRIRLDADASNLYVAWNSDVAWADNLFLTVLQQFLPWSVRQRIVPPTIYKDYNIAYTDQTTNWPPVAMMGDNVCKLFSANPTPVYFDGSESYAVAPGATITGYAWDFGDGSSSAVVTPGNHNYTAAGTYYASLTVTDSNGKTHLTRRIISLPDPATVYTVKFEGTSLDVSIDDGWKAKVRVFDPNADISHFPERAPCFIISNDTYAGVAGSVGFPLDRENVVFFGYIVEDSVAVQPLYNEISFDIESIAGVMSRVDSTPVFLSDTSNPAGQPDAWAWGTNLNVFRGLVFLLKFHSTILDIADVELYNDVTLTKAVDYPQDNLWNMLVQFGKGKRLLHTGVTRTGRIIVGRDPNLTPQASRGTFVTTMQLVQGDWREQVTIPQRPYPITSFLCLSGLSWDGDPTHEPNPLFGMSPGRPPKDYGSEKEMQYLKLVDQVEANTLAGLLVGTDNMPYGDIVIPMRGNWVKVFEPARQEYLVTPSGGFVTKRGTLLDSIPLIVRKVSVKLDWTSGTMMPTLTCDYYSAPDIGVDGDCFPPDAPPPPQVKIPPIVKPPAPLLPVPPVMGAHSNTCVGGVSTNTLNWTYSGSGTPTYYVERSLYPSYGFVVIGTTGSLSYADSTVVPIRTYYYRVRGKVGLYYTPYSAVVSQKAVACAPVPSVFDIWSFYSSGDIYRGTALASGGGAATHITGWASGPGTTLTPNALVPSVSPKVNALAHDTSTIDVHLSHSNDNGATWSDTDTSIIGGVKGFGIVSDHSNRNVVFATFSPKREVTSGAKTSIAGSISASGFYDYSTAKSTFADWFSGFMPIYVYATTNGGASWTPIFLDYVGQLAPTRVMIANPPASLAYVSGSRKDSTGPTLTDFLTHICVDLTEAYAIANGYSGTWAVGQVGDVGNIIHTSNVLVPIDVDKYVVCDGSKLNNVNNLDFFGPFGYPMFITPRLGDNSCYVVLYAQPYSVNTSGNYGSDPIPAIPLELSGGTGPMVLNNADIVMYVYKVTAAGSVTRRALTTIDVNFGCADLTNNDHLFILGEAPTPKLYRYVWSTDTLTTINAGITATGSPLQIMVTTQGTILIPCDDATILRSTDGGVTFSAIDLNAQIGQSSLFIGNLTEYGGSVGGFGGTIVGAKPSPAFGTYYYSMDDGVTWQLTGVILDPALTIVSNEAR